jgi:hypothetical protein
MKVTYNGQNQKLIDAVDFVNDLFENDKFWGEIESHSKFDYTKYTPKQISNFMKNKKKVVGVKLYCPPFYQHKYTNAYTDPRYPNTLFYNSKKLWRSVGNMVNTIVHEYVHTVDFTEDGNVNVDYGHGTQTSSGKENSAPYWIGNLSEKFFNSEHRLAPLIEVVEIDPAGIIDE